MDSMDETVIGVLAKKMMTTNSLVNDKKENICADQQKGFQVMGFNLLSSVKSCVLWVWGCGKIGSWIVIAAILSS
jgi:hypothetical protein